MNAVPPIFKPIEEWARQASIAINQLVNGGGNNTGTGTLAAAVTTTTVSDQRVRQTMTVILQATSAAAAAAAMYVSAVNDGNFVITHAVPGATPTFAYVLHGA